jgi:hypothetical protein
MSQEEPPVEIVINGVIGWDERSITTNQPMQREISKQKRGLSHKYPNRIHPSKPRVENHHL